MKTRLFNCRYAGAVLLALLALVGQVVAATFQSVSVRDFNFAASAGAGGDSSSAVISEDGRFVLIASTAENLASNSISPASGLLPRRMNVFLRDQFAGTTVLVSARFDGLAGGNGDSTPAAISTNGQFALFESAASDLVSGDTNNARDIFIRDIQSGTTTLISVKTNGGSGNGLSRNAALTPDGRFVVFASAASNLVADDTNSITDVFVRDRQTATTALVSVGAKFVGSALASRSDAPEITPDGRYVVFYSSATNLIPGVNLVGEVYVRDLIGGMTMLASTNARSIALSALGSTNIFSCNHSISADGRYVGFEACTNGVEPFNSLDGGRAITRGVILRHDLLTGNTDTVFADATVPIIPPEDIHTLDMTPDGRFVAFVANTNISGTNATCIRLWDSLTGTNILISSDLSSNVTLGTVCDWPLLDASGRYVAFLCNATNLTTNALTGEFHRFVRDTLTGTTALVNVDTNGIGAGVIADAPAAMSADGRYVAFDALDGSSVANDRNRASDVLLRDMIASTSELISVRQPTLPALSANGNSGLTTFTVSTNGRYVAFTSDADDLVLGDTNGYRDVFVRDLQTGTNLLVSVSTNGTSGDGMSFAPFISSDGRFVAFGSTANNLAPNDTNGFQDVFIRDLSLAPTELVSLSINNIGPGNGDSSGPTVSADGRYVSFTSDARNLVAGTTTFDTRLFVRDMVAGTNYLLVSGVSGRSVTPDGSKIAYTGSSSPTILQVWNASSLTKTTIYSSSISAPLRPAISLNGLRVAYAAGSSITIASLQSSTNWTVIMNGLSGSAGSIHSFSADGRFLAFANRASNAPTDMNAMSDIYLYDTQAGTNLLVSRAFNSAFAPNGAADYPSISADGRFIAYRSVATNSALTDPNEASDVLLFDRINISTTLISVSKSGGATANHISSAPVFSGSGRTLFFQSWASDLRNGDFNQSSDVFALSFDTDNDGMDDQWEQDYFMTLARDGTEDFDNDGATDLFEFQSGTIPADANSIFRAQITAPAAPGQSPQLNWPMQPWRTCRVQFKNDLNDATWQELVGSISIFGTNGTATDLSPAADNRFYRIILSE